MNLSPESKIKSTMAPDFVYSEYDTQLLFPQDPRRWLSADPVAYFLRGTLPSLPMERVAGNGIHR